MTRTSPTLPGCEPWTEADLAGDTLEVARRLLGACLIHCLPEGMVGGRIVETEAYLAGDPASHSFRGPTPRNHVMFGPAGRAYVYVSYGIHHCVNVVTEGPGVGAAVLVRAIEPRWGLDLMRARRGIEDARELASGPGKLCQALGIDLAVDGCDLLGAGRLLLCHGEPPHGVTAAPRVGITKATEKAWRFAETGSPWVSRPRPWGER